jgi:hypothetical protein
MILRTGSSPLRMDLDPMTLEQAFPALQNAPGGAVFAVADNLLDLSGTLI